MDMNQKISRIVSQISQLPKKDKDDIDELLRHDEWGVALETICGTLSEDKISISQAIYEAIRVAGQEMEMESATWEVLKPLIT